MKLSRKFLINMLLLRLLILLLLIGGHAFINTIIILPDDVLLIFMKQILMNFRTIDKAQLNGEVPIIIHNHTKVSESV